VVTGSGMSSMGMSSIMGSMCTGSVMGSVGIGSGMGSLGEVSEADCEFGSVVGNVEF